MVRSRPSESLLLGEWACLGILCGRPAHGYDIALQLAPGGSVGRVWSLSRPLTYRALEQLQQRALVAAVGEEAGKAGGPRTILAPTRRGRAALRRWLAEPVGHIRDVRDELLLKLVLCEVAGVDPGPLLAAQRVVVGELVDTLRSARRRSPATDPVSVWRDESSRAALRFVDRMLAARGP